jgi:hypothetical protein
MQKCLESGLNTQDYVYQILGGYWLLWKILKLQQAYAGFSTFWH